MAGQLHARSIRSATSTTSFNHRQQHPASLARRLLFPHLQPGADLPPLFLSPGCPPELDDEVYDFIALALRAFVNTWWTRLTRYDKEFLPQIAGIITHVVRALERRVLDADLPLLVYGDIPALVTQHYRDYRQAAAKASTSYATGGALSLPQLFHQSQPHMAISADGSIDEEYFRQVFDHVLRECLPSEDYVPEAERFIVREIVLKVVLKDVVPLITQPWFIHKTVLDVLGPCPDEVLERPSPSAHNRVVKSGIVVRLLSAIQRLSGTCIMLIHAYKQAIYFIPIVNQTSCARTRPAESWTEDDTPSPASSTTSHVSENNIAVLPIDLTRGPLEMVSEVLDVRSRLAATAALQFVALLCASFQRFVNKLLCHVLYRHVLSASSLLSVVRLSKRALFPNGYPGPPLVHPTVEEQIMMREQVMKRLAEWSVPAVAVDGVSDEACNRHFVLFLLDALLLCVFPSLF